MIWKGHTFAHTGPTRQLQMSVHFVHYRIKETSVQQYNSTTLYCYLFSYLGKSKITASLIKSSSFVLTKSSRLSLRRFLMRGTFSFRLQETSVVFWTRAVPASESSVRTPPHTNTTWRKTANFVWKPTWVRGIVHLQMKVWTIPALGSILATKDVT